MQATLKNIPLFLVMLERTPSTILEKSRGFTEQALRLAPNKASWSMMDVLWHLLGCDAVWTASVGAMLEQVRPTLVCLHPNDWWKSNLDDSGFHVLLEGFKFKRQAFLKRLQTLNPEDWTREALLNGRRHTVLTQVRRLALHEAHHERQFERLRLFLVAVS